MNLKTTTKAILFTNKGNKLSSYKPLVMTGLKCQKYYSKEYVSAHMNTHLHILFKGKM